MAGMARSQLGAGRVIGFTIGDFAFNLYWQSISLYLLFFYTDVLRLPPATAGAIYMAALIWDAALDPLVGVLADRTRSRHGRYRPYLLFGAVPLAAAFLLMLAAPAWPAPGAGARTLACHVAFRTLYAAVSVPYAALSARVTRDAADRADITAARMVSAALSAVLVAVATMPIVTALSDGLGPRLAWLAAALGYAVPATLILLLAACAARGLDLPSAQEPAGPPLRDKLRTTGANTPLLLVLAAVAATSFVNTIFQKSILYYFKYVVGDAHLGGLALGVLALVSVLCVPPWALLARRRGKRLVWLCGLLPYCAGALLWRLADGHGTAALFGALACVAVGQAAYYVSFWAMLADTVEYGEWKTGTRSESLAFGLLVLGQKAALGLGAGALGLLLSRAGYAADQAQAPAVLAAIKAMMLWAPLAGGAAAGALIAFYPISPARHRAMVEGIAAREVKREASTL